MRHRALALAALAAVPVLLAAGTAAAVSDGNYQPERQHCSGAADNFSRDDEVEEGCHALTFTVEDGQGREYGGVGVQQQPDGEDPGPEDLQAWGPSGDYDPAGGTHVYFGADDNLDHGEHDSSDQIDNGPSDGGAIRLDVDPATLTIWLAALTSGDAAYLLTHPLPVVSAGTGACADGVCASVQTERRVAFQGGNKKKHRDVADYEGKQWDPESCDGPDDDAADCGGKPLKSWANQEGTVYVEPGAQVYEDPDPQSSPIGPYPLPAAYAGTCGVVAGGGPLQAPESPVTNGAGQVDVSTGCG